MIIFPQPQKRPDNLPGAFGFSPAQRLLAGARPRDVAYAKLTVDKLLRLAADGNSISEPVRDKRREGPLWWQYDEE